MKNKQLHSTSKPRRHKRPGFELETLEPKLLLARLAGVELGELTFDESALQTPIQLVSSPQELALRFRPGDFSPADVSIVSAGSDGSFGTADDLTVNFTGEAGPIGNELVIRFADTLPDNSYRMTVVDDGVNPDAVVDLVIDAGTQVSAVVPQPIVRSGGTLTQQLDQIEIYFNSGDLNLADVTNRDFYQLIWTGHANEFNAAFNTVDNLDDTIVAPSEDPVYDAAQNKVTLTFSGPLHTLAGGADGGTFRLRVGTVDTTLPAEPDTPTLTGDPASYFFSAHDVGTLATTPQIFSEQIANVGVELDYPGSNFENGHRQIPWESHIGGFDGDTDISVLEYNFQDSYLGVTNLITENERDLARQVMDLYSGYLGVDFVETESTGLAIMTGDPSPLDPFTNFNIFASDQFVYANPPMIDPILVLNNFFLWNDEPFNSDLQFANGGLERAWFENVMQGIGVGLGIRGASELPDLTIAADENNEEYLFDNQPEFVFPGDHDIVHGQHARQPEGNDIDLYRFQVAEKGVFTAEISAERLAPNASTLDSVLRLFTTQTDAAGNFVGYQPVAQNDDYFSEDSFIQFELEAGEYFVGVSSTGNARYDINVPDTGAGGTSTGAYELRLNFDSTEVMQLRDNSGVAFDGDSDGAPGGESNFWFRAQSAARTHIVDKAGAGEFATIEAALAAAATGDIVRVVGNAGADDDPFTRDDNLPYTIGKDIFGGDLPDGGEINIPQGVTVMIDAGAILKFRQSGVFVGSTAVASDKSGAAFQVLGTPSDPVLLTSYEDDSLGGATGTADPVTDGDWGGVLFANMVDRNEGNFDYENQSIFLNHVGQAEIRYAGGVINLDSRQQIIRPLDMRDARPTIVNSVIVASADAAMSATPDSFEESNFNDPAHQATQFTSDYTRVGPHIRGNRFASLIDPSLSPNTTNGLFINAETPVGNELDRISVSARFDDYDVVHVIAGPLEIESTPGGNYMNEARLDGSLVVDPGIVVKFEAGRIEAGLGTQLLAEGTAAEEVTFTSIFDDRFGRGGVFDTSSDGATAAGAGNWGGIYLSPLSRGSLDHAFVAYAGGISEIEGSTIGFNALEIHQAEARVTNSAFADNDGGLGGQGPARREGRGDNDAAVIFVRGAQPVIVNNQIYGTATGSVADPAAAISINANALNHFIVTDQGRSTGHVDALVDGLGNQGPLIRANRLQDNDLNGMTVRGATLTTQGVWDDADIPHLLFETIYVPDYHTFGGLRLESSSTESLVVKLSGGNAGFTATGQPIDISDRVGGSLQIVGQPGNPVVLTSIADNEVSAGIRLDGAPQFQTVSSDLPSRQNPPGSFDIELVFANEIVSDPNSQQVIDALEQAATFWEATLEDPISVSFDVFFAELDEPTLANASGEGFGAGFDEVRQRMIDDARVTTESGEPGIEAIVAELPLASEINVDFPTDDVYEVAQFISLSYPNAKALGYTDEDLPAVMSAIDPRVARDGVINIDTQFNADGGNMDYENLAFVMIHELGHAMGFTTNSDGLMGGGTIPLSTLDLFRLQPGAGAADFTNAPRAFNPLDEHVFYDGGQFDPSGISIPGLTTGDIPMSRGENSVDMAQASHWRDDAAPEMNGIYIGIMDPTAGRNEVTDNDLRAFDLIGWDLVFGSAATPGAWRSVRIDEFANDRNVDVVTERETSFATATDQNDDADTAEFIGNLAQGEKFGDDVLRLGFEIHGIIDQPSDVDIYSFEGIGGTEVWFDLDRTDSNLDSVVELINADGDILVLSNDSTVETVPDDSRPVVRYPLQKSIYNSNDDFTINPKDAGFRAFLPGAAGTPSTYFVRVRSAGADLDDATAGESQGAYQLQVRLRDVDEVPGTVVKHANLRYATTGIEVFGQPAHSPFLGEQGDVEVFSGVSGNNAYGPGVDGDGNPTGEQAQYIGDPLRADRTAISLAGDLTTFTTAFDPDNPGETYDIDWYQFDVEWDHLASYSTALDLIPGSASMTFDIDYADGTSSADMAFVVLDREGRLVYISDDSNIQNDQTDDIEDLSAGSFGNLDPFLGPVDLRLLDENSVYLGPFYVGVYSFTHYRPTVLNAQFNTPGAPNTRIRLEPVPSIQRIVDEHLDDFPNPRDIAEWPLVHNPLVPPQVVDFLNEDSAVPYHLNDMVMYVTTDTELYLVNPFTGGLLSDPMLLREDVEGLMPDFVAGDVTLYEDSDGNIALYAFGEPINTTFADDDTGHFLRIDPTNGVTEDLADDGVATFEEVPPDMVQETDDGITYEAVMFVGSDVFAVGNRGLMGVPGALYTENIVYQFMADGTVVPLNGVTRSSWEDYIVDFPGAMTDIHEFGVIDTTTTAGGSNALRVLLPASSTSGSSVQLNLIDGVTIVHNGLTYEFDAGPDLLVEVDGDMMGTNVIQDEDFFLLDGNRYEFDTGFVIQVANAANLDAETVTVDLNGTSSTTFEFDNDGVTNPSFITVDVTNITNPAIVANRLVTALNGAGVTAELAGDNRISLIEDVNDVTAVSSSDAVALPILGANGVTAGTIIEIEETWNGIEIADAIAAATGAVGVGQFDNRINFPVVATSDFTATPELVLQPGVGGVSQPGVAPGNLEIDFLVSDDVRGLAVRLANAIGGSVIGSNTVYGISFGGQNDPNNVFGPPIGQATAGLVTGIAEVGGTFYAVDDAGGVFSWDGMSSSLLADLSTQITGGFAGLTTASADLEQSRYDNTLFAISGTGEVVALDVSGGTVTARRDFGGGRTIAETGIAGATGVTFAPLDQNLWHLRNDGLNENPGHEGTMNPDGSDFRPYGDAFYFGDDEANNFAFTGGAQGVVLSQPFDLSDVEFVDLPSLYFTYALGTENDVANDRLQDVTGIRSFRDSFRVYAADDDPVTGGVNLGQWQLLTTNNSTNEFTPQAFDNTTEMDGMTLAWRQAQADLSSFAGSHSVRLRFEFSTAGSFGFGDPTIGGLELHAVAGRYIADGESIRLADLAGNAQTLTFNRNGPANTGPNVIGIDPDFTAEEVAAEIQDALAQTFAPGGSAADAAHLFPIINDGNILRIMGMTVDNQGPLGLADLLFGDGFGAGIETVAPTSPRAVTPEDIGSTRSLDNEHVGVYFDDVIIGLRERGEQISQSGTNTEMELILNNGVRPALSEGRYDLEIRRGDNTFGGLPFTVRSSDTFNLITPDPFENPGLAGATITLSDGVDTVTLEFVDGVAGPPVDETVFVGFTTADSVNDLAAAIVAAINSNYVQNTLQVDITATAPTSSNGQDPPALVVTSGIISLFGDTFGELDSSLGADMVFSPDPAAAFSFQQGDDNRFRDQGQLVLYSNQIVDSLEYGILVDAAVRDGGNSPTLGPPRNLREVNVDQLAPGVTITNNLLVRGGSGGIFFSGDENLAGPAGAIPFGRLINNTVVAENQTGIGIEVVNNAGPTLMNNIVSGFQQAIRADDNGLTVVAGTLFQDNLTIGTAGDFPLFANPGDPLFVSAETDNYLIAAGSLAIDSSVDNLEDRPNMASVRQAAGYGLSPILAPALDNLGQIRVDDPTVSPPPNLAGALKDRGAFERADFSGPRASLLNPLDEGPDDAARQGLENIGRFVSSDLVFDQFLIQLLDDDPGISGRSGVGIDDATVQAAAVTVRRNGEQLVEGEDYNFFYDSVNDVIRLVPVSGVWRSGSYEIVLDNSATGIRDLNGQPLLPTENAVADGLSISRLLINLDPGPSGDYGDAPAPYPTLWSDSGAVHLDPSVLFLGAGADVESDGAPSLDASADTDDGVSFGTSLLLDATTTVTVAASAPGFLDAWVDFNQDGDWNDAGEQVFASTSLVTGGNVLSFVVPSGALEGTTFARFRFSSEASGLAPTGPTDDGEVEDYQVTIEDAGSDFGDAPDPYPTASHRIVPGYHLGATNSAEAGTTVDDLSDDGIDFGTSVLLAGFETSVTAMPTAPGVLEAWIDFNADGDFDDAGEQLLGGAIPLNTTRELDFTVPNDATIGPTWARFRFSDGLVPLGPGGAATVAKSKITRSASSMRRPAGTTRRCPRM